MDRNYSNGRLNSLLSLLLFVWVTFGGSGSTIARQIAATANSPDGRNSIVLNRLENQISFTIFRNGQILFGPSPLGPDLAEGGTLCSDSRIDDLISGKLDETFTMSWGKTKTVTNRCSYALVTLVHDSRLKWQIELRAFDDGVAFRYRLLGPKKKFTIRDEVTRFDVVGQPTSMFNTLNGFTTSHESLYERKPFAAVPTGKLLDCPLLLVWPEGPAAAITEARVRNFSGMYLERDADQDRGLRCRLSPLPSHSNASVIGTTPHESPWRVVLLADQAGKMVESNLLLCLNDPPDRDFSWAKPGKTTFHWWYGEFEDDFKLTPEKEAYVARHRKYIDFCALNKIAYHSVSGDGMAWYQQSKTGYGKPAADANVCLPRPELGLPEILAYARSKGVGIRLWVHWKPLSEQLDEAMNQYQSWGVKGLMVDFLDRDDHDMLLFTDRLLKSAAEHRIHIQIHGSSKYSGEQRTFPNLFNREGVLNLEYNKWSKSCTPDHSVNVAYTRALAGPVDFHLGGFRSVARAQFEPRDRAPHVMGTRCHHLALYVVYENPMPMVADSPTAYQGQIGFDFIKMVPTTWDETRFLAGDPGEYFAVARRNGNVWYLAGITNWSNRTIDLSFDFLAQGSYEADMYVDGSLDESQPNAIRKLTRSVNERSTLQIQLAPGGGFVGVLTPN